MAEQQLPPDMQTLRPELGTIIAEMETHFPYAAALLTAAHGLRITVEDREERISETLPVAGVTLTAYDGATLHEAAVSGFDRTAIRDAVRLLTDGLHHNGGPRIDPRPERRGDFETPMVVAPDSLSTQEKLERLRQLHHKVRALDPQLSNVRINYFENGRLAVFRNRAADLAQRIVRVTSSVLTVASREDGVRYDYDIKDGKPSIGSISVGS